MQRIAVAVALVLLTGAPLVDAKAHDAATPAHPGRHGPGNHATPQAAPTPDAPEPAPEPARAPAALTPSLATTPHGPTPMGPPASPTPLPIAVPDAPHAADDAPEPNAVSAAAISPPLTRSWALPIFGAVLLGTVAVVSVRPRSQKRPAPATSPEPAPSDVTSFLRAAQVCAKVKRYAEALKHLDGALALEPDLAVAHFCRGVCLGGLARHEEALGPLRRAHQLDPREGSYRYELARACARLGRTAEAIRALAPVVHAAPEMAEDMLKDDAFRALRDHPVFLSLVGVI